MSKNNKFGGWAKLLSSLGLFYLLSHTIHKNHELFPKVLQYDFAEKQYLCRSLWVSPNDKGSSLVLILPWWDLCSQLVLQERIG